MKRCGGRQGCGSLKPRSEFYPAKKVRDGLSTRCKACDLAHARAWAKANPRRTMARHLRHKFALSLEEWDEMLCAQAGRCGVCSKPMRAPEVDHCHTAARVVGVRRSVRALLCRPCNMLLGSTADDPELLEAAAAYILSHKEA